MESKVIERHPLPDSGKRSEFQTGSVRDACEGKGIPSLIPVSALRSVAKRFEDGATKYGRDNWNSMCLQQTDKWISEGKLPKELRDI